jgi:hypothetical protein
MRKIVGQMLLMGNKSMGKKLERALDNFAIEQAIMG